MIETESCNECFGTGRHRGRFEHNGPQCSYCGGTGLIKRVPSDLLDALRDAVSQRPPVETAGRAKLVSMLEGGVPLAGCLGGLVILMQNHGTPAEREIAVVVDDVIKSLFARRH